MHSGETAEKFRPEWALGGDDAWRTGKKENSTMCTTEVIT